LEVEHVRRRDDRGERSYDEGRPFPTCLANHSLASLRVHSFDAKGKRNKEAFQGNQAFTPPHSFTYQEPFIFHWDQHPHVQVHKQIQVQAQSRQ
jgi:hypothetical protein